MRPKLTNLPKFGLDGQPDYEYEDEDDEILT